LESHLELLLDIAESFPVNLARDFFGKLAGRVTWDAAGCLEVVFCAFHLKPYLEIHSELHLELHLGPRLGPHLELHLELHLGPHLGLHLGTKLVLNPGLLHHVVLADRIQLSRSGLNDT
jgi:hypothetical protein